MAFTSEGGVSGTVSQERWERSKEIFSRLWNVLENQGGRFNHADLLSDRGFLIYVVRTYPTMRPYLKGINLTIERWRKGRDEEGWKDYDWYDDFPAVGANGVMMRYLPNSFGLCLGCVGTWKLCGVFSLALLPRFVP
jgi:hypothetical protein